MRDYIVGVMTRSEMDILEAEAEARGYARGWRERGEADAAHLRAMAANFASAGLATLGARYMEAASAILRALPPASPSAESQTPPEEGTA